LHQFLLPKLTEASKAKKNDSKISTMTMPKTMTVQNLCRYISFERRRKKMLINSIDLILIADACVLKIKTYRGFSPYATFGTWKKIALAKNRISKIFILCTQ
jgi:hypothetical protein